MKKLIIILSVLFLSGCAIQGIKHPSPVLQSQTVCLLHDLLTRATDSVYQIYTTTTIKSEYNKEGSTLQNIYGNTFAIDKHRLLTVGHAVLRDRYYVPTPFGRMTMYFSPEDVVKEETWLVLDDGSQILTKVIHKNTKLDFAILEVEEELSMPTYLIGNSDNLRILDRIFVIANIGYGEDIKTGSVMQLNYIQYTETFKVDEYNEDMFGLCVLIRSGDSGSPILLLRDGHLEVEGIVVLGDDRGSGYGVKINSVMDNFRDWQNEREL